MKLSKDLQKQFLQEVKLLGRKEGFKYVNFSLYKLVADNFIYVDYLIVGSNKMIFRLYIKRYSYDNFFWNIMNMSDNIKKRDSLRANAAFKAPAVLIKRGEYELSDDVIGLSQNFINEIVKESNDFILNNEVNNYVFNHAELQDYEILKCLAYLDINDNSKATQVALEMLDSGDNGRFENEGKGFFEWLIEPEINKN